MRLHWGCGPVVADGWVNVDRQDFGQGHVHDLTGTPLPFPDDTFDYAVSNHALQEIGYHQLVPTLAELRRVLRPGGTLRLIEPDLFKAMSSAATLAALIADDVEPTFDGKVCAWATFYSHRRSVFTLGWLMDLCHRAGFATVVGMPEEGVTLSGHPAIVELDSRWPESCVIEATK